MNTLLHRAYAHLIPSALLVCGFAAGNALAQDSGRDLTLEEATRLALEHQPLLDAQSATVRAARESAVSASQLPDPRLSAGVSDLPIDGPDRYSLRRDNFTMLTVGVMQDFPRAAKRRLRGERATREAELNEQELEAMRLTLRRDAALAWLDVWQAQRQAELARASEREAELQSQSAEIAYRNGKATQADVLAARLSVQLVRDEIADQDQRAAQAQNALSRWIGAEAFRPAAPELPVWRAAPELDRLLTQLRTHPMLNAAAKQTEVAQADVQLARAGFKPDWGVELEYANRIDFPDYVGLKVSMDLPFFTANRQDRGLAAKLQEQDRAEDLHQDLWRQQEAQARQSLDNWQRLQARLERYDQDILPQSAQRIEAAQLAWQSGQGTLAAVLDARRMFLGNRMKRLELERDAAINRLNLQFLSGETP